ncbi:MAG: hypothetical protein U0M23_02110 [Acutalibacteraceae bacterium]|nr:hypothetical protein [Acutalibacteraceae bacterium]HIR02578.1 hypothetical protein [Candidatus Scatovicinus merdipullorum]
MKKILAVLFAVLLISVSSVAALAAPSPTAPVIYNVTVEAQQGGSVHSSVETVQQGDQVILTATVDDGYIFTTWNISGEYEIIEGSLSSERIVVRPDSDIHATAGFKAASADVPTSPTEGPAPGPGNDSPTSPQTGYDGFVFAGLSVLLLSGIVLFAVKTRSAKAK